MIVLCITVETHAQTPANQASVRVNFSWQHHYNETVFNKPVYSNVHGHRFSVSLLRYYVGNVALHRDDGHVHTTPGYRLIIHDDQVDDDPTSHQSVDIAGLSPGRYTSVSFTVGVDSSDNVAGPKDGDLDPLLGMYWTWATGYIFFKMEGTSPASTQPKNIIEYHLGGYQAPYNNLQRIKLDLRRPLVVGEGKQSLEITFDLGVFLDQDGGIDFSTTPSVTDVKAAAPFMSRLKGAFHVR